MRQGQGSVSGLRGARAASVENRSSPTSYATLVPTPESPYPVAFQEAIRKHPLKFRSLHGQAPRASRDRSFFGDSLAMYRDTSLSATVSPSSLVVSRSRLEWRYFVVGSRPLKPPRRGLVGERPGPIILLRAVQPNIWHGRGSLPSSRLDADAVLGPASARHRSGLKRKGTPPSKQ